jgi:hypothetical protein
MAKIPRSTDAASQRVTLLRLAVSFTPETAALLAEEAALAGMTRTALVRQIVVEWLREKRRPSAAPGATGPPPEG